MDELQKMATTAGVDVNDVNAMKRNGLTVATVKKAASLGLKLSAIRDMFFQFGPQFITILITLLGSLEGGERQKEPISDEQGPGDGSDSVG